MIIQLKTPPNARAKYYIGFNSILCRPTFSEQRMAALEIPYDQLQLCSKQLAALGYPNEIVPKIIR